METIHVQQTKDYDLFKNIDGNRSINQLHVKRLSNSMMNKHLISPIIVNEKYQIIDGQHRFEASKNLDLPVYYIVIPGYGLEEVQILNQNSKNWSVNDFLDGYCNLGKEDYIKFRDFVDQYDFSISTAHAIAMNAVSGGNQWNAFKNGNFVFDDYLGAIERADRLTALKAYTDLYNDRHFVFSMIKLINNPDFEFITFLQKLSFQNGALVPCRDVKTYITLIEEIYNYKSRNKVNLRF